MKYLDEVIEASISDTYAGVMTGIYQYSVCRKNTTGNTNTYTTIFVGNMYHEYGTRFILDITDIVRNDVWVPDENTLYNNTDVAAQNIRLVDSYKVIFQLSALSVSSTDIQVAKVYRYPHILSDMTNNIFFDYTISNSVSFPLQGRYSSGSNGYYHLLPRYPYISTDNYKMILVSEDSLGYTSGTMNISGEIVGKKTVTFTPPATLTTYSLSNLYSGSAYHIINGSMLAGYQGQTSYYSITLPSGSIAGVTPLNLRTDELYVKLVRFDSNHDIVEEYTPVWIMVCESRDVQITLNSDFLNANDNSKLALILSPRHDAVITNVDEVDRISYKFDVSSTNPAVLNKTAVCTIQFRGTPLRLGWTIPKFDLEIPMTSDKTLVEVAGDYVAEIDYDCQSRYYLQWQDRMGGFQSQPFNNYYTYSENTERETVTNYKGIKKVSSVNVTPNFKINTDWIKEDLYPYYESIFTSPVLFLYDTIEDVCYCVNLKDTEYEEKTFKNQKKMFNLTLNLEQNKTQNIIY